MQRINVTPRQNWEDKVKEQGFCYYKDYYNEKAAYTFTSAEVAFLEKATASIFEMCLEVVKYVLKNELWDEFFIDKKYADLIKWSWEQDMMSFYGRLDLGYNGTDIKLLEFNADTPTSLLEASVIQWYWLQDYDKSKDQFNSIHEKLVAHLKVCKPYFLKGKLYFSCINNSYEDFITVKYLQDAANQAEVDNDFIYIEDVSLNEQYKFCTRQGAPINNIFKLYPYEWLFNEKFGDALVEQKDNCFWVEPAYKAILSNKMLLKYLYKLFPDSPYILPCEFNRPVGDSYVRKPVYSREGSNIKIVKDINIIEETAGEYGEEGYLFQEYFDVPKFDGMTPIIGSWLIGGVPGGMGIRESKGLITDNMAMFCPHFIN